jgi:hypothetical protein
MSLIDKLFNPGPEVYYDPEFRNVFEDHLNWLLNTKQSSFTSEVVDDNTAGRFAGDWRGLMLAMNKEPYMAWYHMRVNGYSSTTEYPGHQTTIRLISNTEVDKLAAQFRTKKKN